MSNPNQSVLTELHKLLASHFDLEELRTLCFNLGIEYDDLRGEGKTNKARELIGFLARRQRLPELVELARKGRPKENWPSVPELIALESTTTPPPIEIKHFEPETVCIPAGAFLMGSPLENGAPKFETPQHEVYLDVYRIGRYPVTNAEYAEFLKHETHQDVPGTKEWWNRQPPKEKARHPVVGVSWREALDYCAWLKARTGRSYRLPTEAEWEKAARGTAGQRFPWGDEWKEERCNSANDSTTPVGRYSPGGDSPYGCADMLGNVEEWTQTLWGSDRTSPTFVYPYRSNDGREEVSADAAQARDEYLVHRGGSYRNRPEELRCAARGVSKPASRIRWRGFRVLLEL